MKTVKKRKLKNKTIKRGKIKGGTVGNTKLHLVVRKSKLDSENKNLIYDLIIAKPAFPFISDYILYSMNTVDEALALIKPKQDNPKSKFAIKPTETSLTKTANDNEVDRQIIEYGYNKPESK
jgi:hypothetical protein